MTSGQTDKRRRGRKISQESPVSIKFIPGLLVWKVNQRKRVWLDDVYTDPSYVTLKLS